MYENLLVVSVLNAEVLHLIIKTTINCNYFCRISGMVNKLAVLYGEQICEIDGKIYHSFPTIDKLTGINVEEELRNSGFGYRAKYISKSAQMIADAGGDKWLKELKNMDYPDAKSLLCV